MAIGLVPISGHRSSDQVVQDQFKTLNHLLRNSIVNASHNFLRASPSLHEAALSIAKIYLDPLAKSVSEEQNARLQAARRKRKRGEGSGIEDVLRLKQLHVQDFSTDQIWEQSKRILDAAAKELQVIATAEQPSDDETPATKTVHFADDDSASGSAVSGEDESETEFHTDVDDDVEDDEDPEDVDSEAEADPLNGHDEDGLDEGSDLEAVHSDDLSGDEDTGLTSKSVFTKDKHGLNDGFFSIDDFNRATEHLEQIDARGDPDDGAASDEEDIDWTTNPMNQSLPTDSNKSNSNRKSRDDEDGPTFGNADLNVSWSDEEDEDEDEDMADVDDNDDDTNEIYYKDFFAPPPRALTKTKRRRALPKTQPAEVQDEDIQRTISAVHRDIFSDDDIEGSEQSDEQANQNLSTHERRQKVLAEQIRKLEAEAVAKRQWTLTGEARAADRPVNSLLENDLVLDFERAGKPVPEATAATTEAIEDLIKARILARNFDEIPKRIAGLNNHTGSAQGKRGLMELDDRKNQQSLAEIYETEHLKATDPNYVDSRDAETKKAHQEIEALWKSVSAQLDSLTSWHYKPKPADMEVRVLTDAPRVQMEDARPAGVGIGAEESGLAPQEVYRVGQELNGKKGDANVVVTPGGALVSREELTREQKLRRRRREKERIKKKGTDGATVAASASAALTTTDSAAPAKRSRKAATGAEKKNILEELRRGNVKVIGKGGAVQDVEGKKSKLGTGEAGKSVGGLKL